MTPVLDAQYLGWKEGGRKTLGTSTAIGLTLVFFTMIGALFVAEHWYGAIWGVMGAALFLVAALFVIAVLVPARRHARGESGYGKNGEPLWDHLEYLAWRYGRLRKGAVMVAVMAAVLWFAQAQSIWRQGQPVFGTLSLVAGVITIIAAQFFWSAWEKRRKNVLALADAESLSAETHTKLKAHYRRLRDQIRIGTITGTIAFMALIVVGFATGSVVSSFVLVTVPVMIVLNGSTSWKRVASGERGIVTQGT